MPDVFQLLASHQTSSDFTEVSDNTNNGLIADENINMVSHSISNTMPTGANDAAHYQQGSPTLIIHDNENVISHVAQNQDEQGSIIFGLVAATATSGANCR